MTKGEVQRARLALIKAGRHPSIDAIRIELGNTGSKATIFRHLKEIEADEGGAGVPQGSVSEELMAFVTNLAGRLEFEAQERFDALKAGHAEEVRGLKEQLEKARGEARSGRSEAERSQIELSTERTARQRVEAELAALRLEHGQVTTQLTAQLEGVQEQLKATQAQVASLEEKHIHAREALEHFRNASREQRDREARQHEQQLQYLQREVANAAEALTAKQTELRSALQEKADALAHLFAARAERRQVDDQLRELKSAAERLAVQNQLVANLRDQAQQAAQQYEILRVRASDLEQRNGELERLLAGATATAQLQGDMVKELLARISQPAPAGKAKGKAAAAG
ncbi:DNA-binding protein [Pelomonas aquatica]|uniref:DNA-binding protein n=1 Tax=Pelomonas aquatica TaxID=431058 RepID=UPI00227C12C6|nr:DNA-binding protein [Pelomonas aquatica]MBI3348314.1 DNA-binding protein [Burkholderiales bacterium]MCY4754262.1 DNA-binding protein [Pelomonas aquatica]